MDTADPGRRWLMSSPSLCRALVSDPCRAPLAGLPGQYDDPRRRPIDAPLPGLRFECHAATAWVFVDLIPQEKVLDPMIGRLGLDTTWRQLRQRMDIVVEGRKRGRSRSRPPPPLRPGRGHRRPSHSRLQDVAFGLGVPPIKGTVPHFGRIDAMQRHIVRAQRAASVHAGPDTQALVARWNQALASMYRDLARAGFLRTTSRSSSRPRSSPVPRRRERRSTSPRRSAARWWRSSSRARRVRRPAPASRWVADHAYA